MAALFTPPLPSPPARLTGTSQATAGTTAKMATLAQVSVSAPSRAGPSAQSAGRRRASSQAPPMVALIQTLSSSP